MYIYILSEPKIYYKSLITDEYNINNEYNLLSTKIAQYDKHIDKTDSP